MRISPESGISRPAIVRSSVLFPQPLGPTSTTSSPSSTSRSIPRRIALLPSFFWTARSVSAATAPEDAPPADPALPRRSASSRVASAILSADLLSAAGAKAEGREDARLLERRPRDAAPLEVPAPEVRLGFGPGVGVEDGLVGGRPLADLGEEAAALLQQLVGHAAVLEVGARRSTSLAETAFFLGQRDGLEPI